MKIAYALRWLLPSLIFLFALSIVNCPALAGSFTPPKGENTVGKIVDVYTRLAATNNAIYVSHCYYNDTNWDSNVKLWTPKSPNQIKDIKFKFSPYGAFNGTFGKVFVLLDNGEVHLLSFSSSRSFKENKFEDYINTDSVYVKLNSYESTTFKDIVGDETYVLTSSAVFSTTDIGNTWVRDTSGLNGAYPNAFAMDSSQSVYLASSKGLFWQKTLVNSWTQVTTLPSGNNKLNSVFIDRNQRLFVSTDDSLVYVSNDLGKSWNKVTNGLSGSGVTKFGDDAFGNIYGIVANVFSGDRLFRLDLSGSWTEIGKPLSSQSDNNKISISGVGGDSVIVATTNFGIFSSSDKGNTWTESNDGIKAEKIMGFVKTKSGNYLMRTNLGVFLENQSGNWAKTYPVTGYSAGNLLYNSIYNDKSGNIYIFSTSNAQNSVPPILKSTDEGSTWQPDTNGLSIVKGSTFYIDELGGQHFASSQYGSSFYTTIYYKPAGGQWQLDTLGFSSRNSSYASAFFSDGKGSLYLSGYNFAGGLLIKRSLSGGKWTSVDTTGLTGVTQVSLMASDNNGLLYCSDGKNIYYLSGNSWNKIPLPSELKYASVRAITFDSKNNLFAGFSQVTAPGGGVFYTSDNGSVWNFAGLDIPNIAYYSFKVFGDTLFAATNHGAYTLSAIPLSSSINFYPGYVDFGSVPVGQTKDTLISIYNSSLKWTNFSSVTSDNSHFGIESPMFYPGMYDTLHFDISFTPTSDAVENGTITFTSDDTPPLVFNLQVTGKAQKGEGVSDGKDNILSAVNYPNPFTDKTTISYSVLSFSHVTVNVYNLLGEKAALLFDGMQSPGGYTTEFTRGSLPPGIYYYEIVNGSGSVRKSMVIY